MIVKIETAADIEDVIQRLVEYFRDCPRALFVTGSYNGSPPGEVKSVGRASFYCSFRGGSLEEMFTIMIAKIDCHAEYISLVSRLRLSLLESGRVVMMGDRPEKATHKLMTSHTYDIARALGDRVVHDDCYVIADDTDAFMIALRLGARLEKLK